MKLKWNFLSVFLLVSIFSVNAQDITNNTFGKGLVDVVAKDSSYSVNFAARFQSLFTSDWDFPGNSNLSNGESNFLIRRARLKFKGFAFSPNLRYKMELGLSNRDISGASEFTHDAPRYILDAVIKWNFYENFDLWVGQTKLPGNRERIISSGNMQTVDRSLVNSVFNVDREMGIQLHHSIDFGNDFLLKESVAFTQGEGRNVTRGNIGGYHFTGRAEIYPFGDFDAYSGADFAREPSPKLAIGAAYSYNDDAVKTESVSGDYMMLDNGFYETDIETFFLDAMMKYKGLTLMTEYANRTAENPIAVDAQGVPTGDVVQVGNGFVGQAAYLFPSNFEVVGRYTTIALDEGITGEGVHNQYTLGVSKYILKHKLKVQSDISLNDFENNLDNGVTYRLQVDIHF
ncbi:porin [Christiangramia salexigens]|uniref:Porin n=1 Tax=Christiangramia salexigens TaxID=1913577 RepID=A0A1L3J294_9FLAO|nr:porin [Christiangramia salexigens]APG59228.1 porin [Christiangramia salexigens]